MHFDYLCFMETADAAMVSLLLGSNKGNRSLQLEQAISALESEAGEIVCRSAIYETAAWGKEDQPAFLNMVVLVKTTLEPQPLLAAILSIEETMGRTRQEKWAERTIDIDILLYGDAVLSETNLEIPHPHLPSRRFALIPLCEIRPNAIHPISGQTIAELLDSCNDLLPVRIFNTLNE